jgi:hypothetical protein
MALTVSPKGSKVRLGCVHLIRVGNEIGIRPFRSTAIQGKEYIFHKCPSFSIAWIIVEVQFSSADGIINVDELDLFTAQCNHMNIHLVWRGFPMR